MSKINDILAEAETKLQQLNTDPFNLTGKIVVCDKPEYLLDALKGMKSYPGVGIVYEGMRSVPSDAERTGKTARVGASTEVNIAVVLVEQGYAIHPTLQKTTRALDYLNVMRDQFLGKRSTATGHFWHFAVEAPAELTGGMVVWIQRWTVPCQWQPTNPVV